MFNDYFFQITCILQQPFTKKHFRVRFFKIDPTSVKQDQKFVHTKFYGSIVDFKNVCFTSNLSLITWVRSSS